MKEFAMKVLPIVVGVIVGLILYDKFVKSAVGNYESDNSFDVAENGDIMKVA